MKGRYDCIVVFPAKFIGTQSASQNFHTLQRVVSFLKVEPVGMSNNILLISCQQAFYITLWNCLANVCQAFGVQPASTTLQSSNSCRSRVWSSKQCVLMQYSDCLTVYRSPCCIVWLHDQSIWLYVMLDAWTINLKDKKIIGLADNRWKDNQQHGFGSTLVLPLKTLTTSCSVSICHFHSLLRRTVSHGKYLI